MWRRGEIETQTTVPLHTVNIDIVTLRAWGATKSQRAPRPFPPPLPPKKREPWKPMHLFTMQEGLDGAVLDVPEDVLGPRFALPSFFSDGWLVLGQTFERPVLGCTEADLCKEIGNTKC